MDLYEHSDFRHPCRPEIWSLLFFCARTGVVEKQVIETDYAQKQEERYSRPFLAQDKIRKEGENEYAP